MEKNSLKNKTEISKILKSFEKEVSNLMDDYKKVNKINKLN